MDIVKSNEVFTPATSAKLTFVERQSVNTQIVNTLSTPGKQLVVYGHSGSGKTTLIVNKLTQIYENHITVRCTSTLKYEEIILQAFDELNPYYHDSYTTKNTNSSVKLKSDYKIIKAEIGLNSSQTEEGNFSRILPPTLTMQTLARLLGNARCCLVLEDFHKIDGKEKTKLSQTMKLFVDMAEEYPELKIICIGAVSSGRDVVQYDIELKNRVSEIEIPLMVDKEIEEIIDLGFPLLNIEIPTYIKQEIVKIVNGVPAACHAICLHICFNMNILCTTKEKQVITLDNLEQGVFEYIKDSSDSIKADFDMALIQRRGKYKNAHLILRALSTFTVEGIEQFQLLTKIRTYEENYPASNLSTYLRQLMENSKGAILIKRGAKICFRSPIYKTYAQQLFSKPFTETITPESIDLDIKVVQEKLSYLKKKWQK